MVAAGLLPWLAVSGRLASSSAATRLPVLLVPGPQKTVAWNQLDPEREPDVLTDQQLLAILRDRESGLIRVRSLPFRMEQQDLAFCRAPALQDDPQLNPHRSAGLYVYTNAAAVAPMWDPFEKFPEGSLVVKSKFDPQQPEKVELFTGMLKRAAGFDPEHGDWEYFTADGTLRRMTARGQLQECRACHTEFAATDHVSKLYAAMAGTAGGRGRWWKDGQWSSEDRVVDCGTSGTIFLPASLAWTAGPERTREEARELNAANPADAAPAANPDPEDFSAVGGPRLRYEPQLAKNTLGYWTNVADTAGWSFQVPRAGRYELELQQGCGAESGGARVRIEVAGQSLIWEVEETGHFQNFVWRRVGEVSLAENGPVALRLVPESKPGVAVMDLRQIRLRYLGPSANRGQDLDRQE